MNPGRDSGIKPLRHGKARTAIVLVFILALLYINTDGQKQDKKANRFNKRNSLNIPSGQAGARGKRAMQKERTALSAPCQPVQAQQIYRFIEGIDSCMTLMSQADIKSELNDPYATSVLIPNAGGKGVWPATVADIVSAVSKANPTFSQNSYLLGEGGQIPPSITKLGNQDLRYLITWGPGNSPVIFLSAAPAGAPGGTPPGFLQVIAFDPIKKNYNYYQYVCNSTVAEGNPCAASEVQTWSWAGDSSNGRNPQTVGRGCFDCHLNGGLNMKELTVPWNNWHSTAVSISAANIPAAVANDPLYQNLSTADKFQTNFQGTMFNFTTNWVNSNIQSGAVSNVSELLRRLIVTTTVNFASSQVRSADTSDVTGLPMDFFLNDSIFRGNSKMNFNGLNFNYTVPATIQFARSSYNSFLTSNNFALVNTANNNGPPDYRQPGATYFAFFIPVPAYEDLVAIKQLISRQIISAKFAVAVLMVDFQNPIFSAPRASLMTYANQISTGNADGQSIPNQFAALVQKVASGQPACNTSNLSQCTPEQQFLFYWNQSNANWQAACQTQIQNYLNAVGARISTQAGVNDYMTLSISRGIQFSNYPLVCNLHEFDLLLPCNSLGNTFVQMNADGTTSPQASYQCPPPQGFISPCASTVFTRFVKKR
jgi:hypothetical protein